MILNENPADNMLRAALEGNDPAAVGLLWDHYAKDLLAYLQAILCSLHDAEDVLQMVFVRIVRKRHQLAKARCLDAYIYRIARNEALSLIDRRKADNTAKTVQEPWLIKSESSRQSQGMAESLQTALARYRVLRQPQKLSDLQKRLLPVCLHDNHFSLRLR